MQSLKVPNYSSLTTEERNLIKVFLSEYNDTFHSILILPSKEFIGNITKRVELALKKIGRKFREKSKNTAEDFIIEKIYLKEVKLASNAMKIIKKKIEENTALNNIFNGKIIEHCNKDKKDGYYIHSCGEKFYFFKYKPLVNFNNLDSEPNKNILETFLICIKCDMIYKGNFIRFTCNDSNYDFYSKIIKDDEINKELPFATWKKYHCNLVINDTMKCPICKESFYYDKNKNILICKKCNSNVNPEKTVWKCLICKNDFKSEVKEYNNLEFKNIKICINDTLINKIKAYPEVMGCNCHIHFDKIKFFHKNSCKGDLYLGKMNNKKIVVCNKCEALGFYDSFSWTCPLCGKRFKIKNIAKNNINRTFSAKKEINDEQKNKNLRKNLGLSPFYKKKNDNESVSPNVSHNIYIHSKKSVPVNSPLINLKKFIAHDNDNLKSYDNEDDDDVKIKDQEDNNDINDNMKDDKLDNEVLENNKYINKNSISTASKSDNNSIKLEKISNNLDNEDNNKENNKSNNKRLDDNINQNIKDNNKEKEDIIKEENMKENEIKETKNLKEKDKINKKEDINTKEIEKEKEKEIKNEKEIKKKRKESEKEEILEEEKEEIKKYDITDYVIKEQIGEGSFGKIFKVESPDGKYFALKKLIITNKYDYNNLQHEYNILENIMKKGKNLDLISIYQKETKQIDSTTFIIYVLMDLATSDWEKEIERRRKNNLHYEEKELTHILNKLTNTFAELQKINISHRDIKPQNILYFKESNKYKLSDFGEAKELKQNNENNNISNYSKQTLRGTQLFMSPILFEALKIRKKRYIRFVNHNTFKSDVYSFGLMAFYAASLSYDPLVEIRELTDNSAVKIVLDKYLKQYYSDNFINLIFKMIEIEESSRCDFIELKKVFEEFEDN